MSYHVHVIYYMSFHCYHESSWARALGRNCYHVSLSSVGKSFPSIIVLNVVDFLNELHFFDLFYFHTVVTRRGINGARTF